MVVFDKNNFNDEDVNYLKFSEEFKVELSKDKIKIILGPNGIGKSSIYKNIQRRFPEYSYIDYNKVEDAMLKSKKILTIASNIAIINLKEQELQSIYDIADIKKTMSDVFDLGSKPKCERISNTLDEYRNDPYKAFKKFGDNKLDVLFAFNDDLKKFTVKYGKQIIEQTIEEANIEEIKDTYKKKYLEMIDIYLNGDEYVCPVCDNKCDDLVKNIIKEKIDKINETTNEIVKDFILSNPTASPDVILDKIKKLKTTIIQNGIDISKLEDFIICGGDREKANYIMQNKTKVEKLQNEKLKLETKKIEFYNNIKKAETRIREIFEKQLGIPAKNIAFDDEKKALIIKLGRDITQYSTGEINLITFIVTLLEFVNSDRDTIIIDDPLSSYDIPNQYKIIYEITSVNSDRDYNIMILTHNIDCVNIAHSQYSQAYKFELMDRVKDILYLNRIEGLEDKGFHISYIINKLKSRGDYSYTEYIDNLSRKDGWNKTDPRHQLFHFDDLYSLPNSTCTNVKLVEIIDDLTEESVENRDSIINSANKVLYFAALRVWIEKQFYDNNDDNQGLRSKKYLADKIKFMLDGNHWTGNAQIKKDFLMSKKVMLNQNEHAESQKEPFYYALSLSMDNIIDEILDIKSHFEN